MSSRIRPTTRRRQRFSLGDEDRQTFLVNAGFVAVIVLLLAILGGGVAWSYYEANLRPVANVAGVEIRPDLPRDRAALLNERIERDLRRVTQAVVDGEIDTATAGRRQQELATARQEIQFVALESVIDLIFQSQLAAEIGISVTPAEVDQRIADDRAGVERRHVMVISVQPETSEGAVGPSFGQQAEARERAEQALAALAAGRPFDQVFAEYNADEDVPAGGDLGFISRAHALDSDLRLMLFELPEIGTTGVVRGEDGRYRIGRVVEIRPAGEDGEYARNVDRRVSQERYRQFITWELTTERLQRRVVDEALGATPEQLRLAHIRIDNVQPDDELLDDDEDEIHYSEILYAPNDDPINAPTLAEEDPAWDEARLEAEAAAVELRAIEDTTERLERFREIAREDSDSDISGPDGGDAGSVTRDLLPEAVGDALFDEEHQPDDLIGPVRADNGWYLLWFHEHRDPPSQRLAQLQEALAQPDVDFAELVERFSDDQQSRAEGGNIGWWTQDMLNQIQSEMGDTLYAVPAGGISEPIGLANSTHVFLVAERRQREIDADQARFIRQNAFEGWYAPRKDAAEEAGVIHRADDIDDDPGIDFGDGFDDFDDDFDEFDFDDDFDEFDDDFGDDVPPDELP